MTLKYGIPGRKDKIEYLYNIMFCPLFLDKRPSQYDLHIILVSSFSAEVYLISLNFIWLYFWILLLFCNPASSKSISTFSNSFCSLHVSVSHLGNPCHSSDFFIIVVFVMAMCDQPFLVLLLQLFWGAINGTHIRWWIQSINQSINVSWLLHQLAACLSLSLSLFPETQ